MHELAERASESLHIDLDVARDFFIVFARFEYALKVCRWVQGGTVPRRLEVDFPRFAASIQEAFAQAVEADADLHEAVDYYAAEPPRKQTWDGTNPDWADFPEPARIPQSLILMVCQVRNNLFHGGKGWDAEGGTERDEKLMIYGLTIIGKMLDCDTDVRNQFADHV